MSHFEKHVRKIYLLSNFFSSVSAVLLFPNFSLLKPFFTFNDVFTYFQFLKHFPVIFISYRFLDFLFSEFAMFLCITYSS